MITLTPRRRRTALGGCLAGVVLSAAMLTVSIVGPAVDGPSTVLAAAQNAGTFTVSVPNSQGQSLTEGGSTTAFELSPPAGAACPGDSTAGWRVHSYFVPASVDPASLTFNSTTGPIPLTTSGADIRLPLFADVSGQPWRAVNTAVNTGVITNIPSFSFRTRAAGDILPGTYNLGFACTNGPASATQLGRYWNIQFTFVANAGDPIGVSWTVGSGSSATTTTSTTTTTTIAGGGGGATTTTTTIGGGGGATTTSTTVAGGGATTSTVAGGGATTTTVPGTRTVSTSGGTVTLSAAGGTLTAFGPVTVSTPAPAGITMPFGQFTFSATTTAGGLVTFTMTLPSPATSYYKLVNNVWANFTFDGETGAQVSGNTVTIRIKDNGRGDSNSASGQITDPGAPTVSQTNVTTTVVSGGGVGGGGVSNPGGSLVATGSSPWSIIVWAVLLLVFGRMAMLLAKPVRVLPPR